MLMMIMIIIWKVERFTTVKPSTQWDEIISKVAFLFSQIIPPNLITQGKDTFFIAGIVYHVTKPEIECFIIVSAS